MQPAQAPVEGGAAQSPSTPPITSAGPRHPILEGTVIEAVLSNRLDGAREAPAVCQVSIPVYSHAGDRILIPAGARFIGRTRPVGRLGQSRLEVTFHRLIFPDGRTVPLDRFVALNQRGDLGLRDRVNNHYASTFAAAAAVGVISGATQALANAGVGASADRTIIVAGGADGTSQAAGNVLNRVSSRLPEVTIREGHRIRIYVTRDIELPAYP
jgi:type IV secretion system protein TrbI